jgi:hypothetical protein
MATETVLVYVTGRFSTPPKENDNITLNIEGRLYQGKIASAYRTFPWTTSTRIPNYEIHAEVEMNVAIHRISPPTRR